MCVVLKQCLFDFCCVDYPDYSNYNENDYEEPPVKFEKEEKDRISQIHNDEQDMGQENNGSNYEYETEQDY